MADIIPITNPQEEARRNFSNHVQSVAFNLALSRRMIMAMQIIRDYGMPYQANYTQRPEEYEIPGRGDFVTLWHALKRRGLAYHVHWRAEDNPPEGARHYNLTRAGELVCELLVEAGLMPVLVKQKKEKRS